MIFSRLHGAGNTQGSHELPMTRDTRIALFLMGELVPALRANDPDAFRGLLAEGMQELGVREVEELLLDWLDPFLTVNNRNKLTGWRLVVRP